MSGGLLVVVDRSGRDVKRYPLPSGLATLGADLSCDIRVLQPQVEPHHATVAVHSVQTVVRNVGQGETLVNGRAVSVAALRHGDVITVGDRSLRWEYTHPHAHSTRLHSSPTGALALPWRSSTRRGARRGSGGAPGPARDRALQLVLEMNHRASMPGSTGGKQVAVVQPQRRDTSEQIDKNLRASPLTPTRRVKNDLNSSITSETDSDKSKCKSTNRTSPKNLLQNTTKATLWIESRKTSPRRKLTSPQVIPQARKSLPAKKSTPLRLTVLKKAQSAQKVMKIEAPLKIDHTKQAAIMLMTGHTPKSKLSITPQNKSSAKQSPSFVVKKQSPIRKTPRGRGRQSGRGSKGTGSIIGVTPSRGSTFAEDSSNRRSSKRNSENKTITILEISDSTRNSTVRASTISTRSRKSSFRSPSLLSPKKSAMKDLSKKNKRKTESIKFDLSNLENCQDSVDALTDTNDTQILGNSVTDDDLTLHYSESSNQSPSPRKSINSRTRSMNSVRLSATPSASRSSLPSRSSRTLTPDSPRARKSIRGSVVNRNALVSSKISDYTKTDLSANTTVASASRTRTLSPRNNLESYSVVDLVSFDSNNSKSILESNNSKSIYNSADSIDTTDFGTPTDISVRKTRSTLNPTLLGSSTPYVGGSRANRSKSSSNIQNKSARSSVSTRRSKSLSTPENKHISVNSTRVSRVSRSRSRINDSDLLLLDDTEVEDSSPKTSKRSRTTKSVTNDTLGNLTKNSPKNQGVSTPENRHSPVEVGTPVLSIQSLLESSVSSETKNSGRRGRRSAAAKRKTIGVLSKPKTRKDNKSKSLGAPSVRKTLLRLSGDSGASSDKTDEGAPQPDNEKTVTPKSAVKISLEDVKNKHSTAKKPQSKRSIIDNLNHSDHVKQLFNSPVKRKLSQSMTEFSRKQLFDDDDDVQQARRPTRNTIALTGRTPNNCILEETEAITPERFVSPITTPGDSPNMSGIKRLFKKNTPENDLRDVRGVRSMLRTPHPRRSIKNDLTKVDAVKALFAKSPRNRLSDVRVKEVFAASPNNDLRRVGGVKSLFQKSPKNDLTDVRGVRKMFQRKSPENNLTNVSGVKRILRNSPKNDLTDVRGVRQMFKQKKQPDSYHDVSGVEELFNESNQSANKSEILFDALIGKPPIKAVYSKTFSTRSIQKAKTRRGKSLHSSIDVITNNVEQWLEKELQKHLHNNSNVTREMKMLATDTVEGGEPICPSRTRNSSLGKKSASEIYSAHKLPIKKRSLAEVSLKRNIAQLPIKKRVVVHSTPVKGRTNLTMNASELGRVSPIAVVDNIRVVEHNVSNTGSTQLVSDEKIDPEPIKARTPRKQKTPKKIDISKPSPNKSPVKDIPLKRSTRNRKNTDNSTLHTKKRRSSIVITKKPPVMSPKAKRKAQPKSPKQQSKETSIESPKKRRATRGKKEVTLETPKTAKTRGGKATVVVAKPSPKLKPKEKENVTKTSQPIVREKSNRSRKMAVVEAIVSPKLSPKRTRKAQVTTPVKEPKTRGKKAEIKSQEPVVEKPVEVRRGRRAAEIEQLVQPKPNLKTKAVETTIQNNKKKRGVKNVTFAESNTKEKQSKTRGKKVDTKVEMSIQPEPAGRGRGRKTDTVVKEKQTETRRNKPAKSKEVQPNKVESQTSVVSEPAPRTRRTNVEVTVIAETKGRKRKAASIEEVPQKVAKLEPKRGKKFESPVTETVVKSKRGVQNKLEIVQEPVNKSTRGTRSKKVEEAKNPKESKPTRTKQVESQESVTAVGSRGKRKANADPSPVKVAAKKAAGTSKKAVLSPTPARGRGRSAGAGARVEARGGAGAGGRGRTVVRAGAQLTVTTQAVGRSRRR